MKVFPLKQEFDEENLEEKKLVRDSDGKEQHDKEGHGKEDLRKKELGKDELLKKELGKKEPEFFDFKEKDVNRFVGSMLWDNKNLAWFQVS